VGALLPDGQKAPTVQGVSKVDTLSMPSGQVKPGRQRPWHEGCVWPGDLSAPTAGHGPLQAGVFRPVVLPKVRLGQSSGALLPATQKRPSGHSLGLSTLPSQNEPAGQRPEHSAVARPSIAANVPGGQLDGAVEAALQYEPSGHTPLQLAVARLAEAPKTPGGQTVGAPLPCAQYAPGGHATAVAELEPRGQYQPAAHGPLHSGVPRPLVAP
jgi:hypothetical protein